MIGRSIIGGRFDCRIEAEARVGAHKAIMPSLAGRAWITGIHQHMLDPSDPWPGGYRLSDTWPRRDSAP
jgi:proline racemase